jgi:hypothetical protein
MGSLLKAYQNEDLDPSMPYRDHINYIRSLNVLESKDYWEKTFNGVEKVSLPLLHPRNNSLPDLHEIQGNLSINELKLSQASTRYGVTSNTLLRAAWALNLKYYTRSDSVVFGSVVSGRDTGLRNVES